MRDNDLKRIFFKWPLIEGLRWIIIVWIFTWRFRFGASGWIWSRVSVCSILRTEKRCVYLCFIWQRVARPLCADQTLWWTGFLAARGHRWPSSVKWAFINRAVIFPLLRSNSPVHQAEDNRAGPPDSSGAQSRPSVVNLRGQPEALLMTSASYQNALNNCSQSDLWPGPDEQSERPSPRAGSSACFRTRALSW